MQKHSRKDEGTAGWPLEVVDPRDSHNPFLCLIFFFSFLEESELSTVSLPPLRRGRVAGPLPQMHSVELFRLELSGPAPVTSTHPSPSIMWQRGFLEVDANSHFPHMARQAERTASLKEGEVPRITEGCRVDKTYFF